MPALLAIDPGTATGVAFCRADGVIVFRTWRLDGLGGGRMLQLRALLNHLHSAERFERLVYEEPFQGPRVQAVTVLRHLEGEILSWSASQGLAALAFTPREIKAGIAGGRATKEDVLHAVRRLGYPVEDDHQGDAVALLLLARTGAQPARKTRKAAVKARQRDDAATDLFAVLRRPRPRWRAAGAAAMRLTTAGD